MYTKHIIKVLRKKLIDSGYDPLIVDELLSFFDTFSCANKNPLYSNDELYQKLCYYSTTFSVIPILKKTITKTGNRWVNGHPLYREGAYGGMFDGEFKGEDVLTKTLKEFTPDIIREIFVNMVIINDILLRSNQFVHNLLPTYGLFACRQNDYKHVCIATIPTGQPYYLNMIQKKVDATTFEDFLHEPATTVEMVYEMMNKIFTVLDQLNQGPYELRHNDLHGHNILIDNYTGEPIIIDYGLSTFTIGGLFYRDIVQDSTREYDYEPTIKNGSAIDIWWVIYMMSKSTHAVIVQYADRLRQCFFSGFLQDNGVPLSFDQIVDVNGNKSVKNVPWFYYMISEIEDALVHTQQMVHDHNVQLIKRMTYRMIVDELINDHQTNAAFFTGKRTSRHSKKKRGKKVMKTMKK